MDVPRDLGSPQVVIRFVLRIVVLAVFATFGHQAYGKALETLLSMMACYCIVAAAIRREAPLGSALTHFDEAAAYLLIACLAAWAA